ncbi:hypothetical protein X961_3539 [Burkholderia pseudomallei MSHR5613]|nr:hypothetical protein X961_3539 [Burkholderia pseudomallei MSHR5613]
MFGIDARATESIRPIQAVSADDRGFDARSPRDGSPARPARAAAFPFGRMTNFLRRGCVLAVSRRNRVPPRDSRTRRCARRVTKVSICICVYRSDTPAFDDTPTSERTSPDDRHSRFARVPAVGSIGASNPTIRARIQHASCRPPRRERRNGRLRVLPPCRHSRHSPMRVARLEQTTRPQSTKTLHARASCTPQHAAARRRATRRVARRAARGASQRQPTITPGTAH